MESDMDEKHKIEKKLKIEAARIGTEHGDAPERASGSELRAT
jgi:hypothetical protein